MSSHLQKRPHLGAGAVLFLVALCMVWGVQQSAIKIGVNGGIPLLFLAAMRSGIGGVMLYAWFFISRPAGKRLAIPRDSWISAGVSSVTFTGQALLFYAGLAITTASRSVLFLYTSPFFVAVATHFLVPGERLRLRQMLGLLCAFAGIVIAVSDGLGGGQGSFLGDMLVLISAVFWGATNVQYKADKRLARIPPADLLAAQLVASGVVLLIAGLLVHERVEWAAVSLAAWLAVGYTSVIVAGLSYVAFYWFLAVYPAGRIAVFLFLTPIFGAAAGALMLGENISLQLGVALLVVVLGLYLVNAAPARRAA